MFVPAARLEVVNSATPSASVSLPIVPLWSLKVTVPPFGVAPPADRSLTVAVNVTDCSGDRRSGRGDQRREGGQGARRADGHGHRRRDLADHVVAEVGDEHVARGIDGDAAGS